MPNSTVTAILKFFDDISLKYSLTELAERTFLPGIKIHQGGLLIDVQKLEFPGDLLHEAGHIAITPSSKRDQLSGDMKDFGHEGGDEMSAIAWSWAAMKHIGLDPSILFHAGGYRGASESLASAFSGDQGFGYPLLYSWFMCEKPGQPDGFPKMKCWYRDDEYIEAQLDQLDCRTIQWSTVKSPACTSAPATNNKQERDTVNYG